MFKLIISFHRLLIVVRDPVTRVISDYTQAASKKSDMKKFEQLAFMNASKGIDTTWGPLKIGVYARHLEKWLRYFPLPQLLVISGERLISDPAFEIGRVQVNNCAPKNMQFSNISPTGLPGTETSCD